MITTILLCVALVCLGGVEGWLLRDILKDTVSDRRLRSSREREAVQRKVIDMQLQAMRAAEQMSLHAWKARHELYDMAADERRKQARR